MRNDGRIRILWAFHPRNQFWLVETSEAQTMTWIGALAIVIDLDPRIKGLSKISKFNSILLFCPYTMQIQDQFHYKFKLAISSSSQGISSHFKNHIQLKDMNLQEVMQIFLGDFYLSWLL